MTWRRPGASARSGTRISWCWCLLAVRSLYWTLTVPGSCREEKQHFNASRHAQLYIHSITPSANTVTGLVQIIISTPRWPRIQDHDRRIKQYRPAPVLCSRANRLIGKEGRFYDCEDSSWSGKDKFVYERMIILIYLPKCIPNIVLRIPANCSQMTHVLYVYTTVLRSSWMSKYYI